MKSRAANSGKPLVAAVAAIGFLIWTAQTAICDEPARAYRRVHVPADRPENWPRDGKSMLPVETAEFDQWIRAVNEPPSSASIVEAEYHARLDGDRLVELQGWWRIGKQGIRAARLNLDASSLSISNAKWRGDHAPDARLGWWPGPNGKGFERGLEVASAGVLEFDWQASRILGDQQLAFEIQHPPAARTTLVLDLPALTRPIIDAGSVLEAPKSRASGGRWRLALAPQEVHVLRIERTQQKQVNSPSTSVREVCRYLVQRTGIDLEATLSLACRGPLPPTIRLRLPPGMQLVSAESGDTALTWQTENASEGQPEWVAIELANLRESPDAKITLRAWGPFDAALTARLPLVQVGDALWNSGELELAVDESLELIAVDSSKCLQVAVGNSGPAEQAVRLLRFSAYEPTAELNIALQHRSPSGKAVLGATLEVSGSEIAGQFVSRIEVAKGQLHELSADVGSAWKIDAVESIPPELLSEWYVDKQSDRNQLFLQLNRAVSAGDRVEIVLAARMPAATTKPISSNDLIPLRWRHLQSARPLVQLMPPELYDLEIDGDWDEQVPGKLPASLRTLLKPTDGARLALLGDNRHATIRLTPKKVAYDATVEIDGAIGANRCELEYALTCNPRGGGIDHVLVFFANPLTKRLQWTDAESGRLLNFEKLPATDPRFGGLPAGGELWRLEFGRLFARPVRIETTTSIDQQGRTTVPLVSLPDAASQQGRVAIKTLRGESLLVEARNLTPAPLPLTAGQLVDSDVDAEVCAVYRFQPTRLYDSSEAPELVLETVPNEATSRPIATRIDAESRYGVDGSGVHRTILQFDNATASSLALQLPEGFVVTSARVDGVAVSATRKNRIEFPQLPVPQARVELEYVSRGRPLASAERLVAPLPGGDFVTLAGEWKVELPVGFRASPDEIGFAADSSERLFGPLARRDFRPFNPIDPGDWNLLWARMNQLFSSPALAAAADPMSPRESMPNGLEAHRFTFGATPPRFLTVTHWRATAAISLAVFMFSAVGAQIVRFRMRTKIWLLLASAAASLLVSAHWAPLATAATLGFAAAAIWDWVQPGLRTRGVAAAICLISAGLPFVASAAGTDSTIERVLVPVDPDGKPTGTKYFVATDFLQQLLARAGSESNTNGWLLVEMKCDGRLVEEPEANAKIVSGEWKLMIDVDTRMRDIVVTLPLVRDEADWQPMASLDGIPAPIEWDENGQQCAIRVAEPGRSRISIGFVPHTIEAGLEHCIRLQLPAIDGARIEVLAPQQLKSIRGETIAFQVASAEAQSVWHGKLAESGQLDLAWPVEIARQAGKTNRRVSELQTLDIESNRVSLELQLSVPDEQDWPETLEIAAETDWRLVTDRQFESAAPTEQLPDGRLLHSIHLSPQTRTESTIRFTFEANANQPWGYLRPPAIELLSQKSTERWLVVTCTDPRLECETPDSVALGEAIPKSLTLAQGLGDASAPRAVVNLDHLDPTWHLSVRPAPARSNSRERVSLAAGRDRFRVNYRADIVPQGKNRFGWSLVVPDNVSIREVTATAGDEQVPLDWARKNSGQLNVFFDRPIERPYRFELQGTMPMPADGVLPLPRIASAESGADSQIVALYRDDDVCAEWQFDANQPWVESGASLDPPFDESARFVRAFSVDAETAPGVRVIIDRQLPRLVGTNLTRVERVANGWEATWDCNLKVERGAIDVLRFDLPAEWAGPFEVSPAAVVQLQERSNAAPASALAIRLPRQLKAGDQLRLSIRSPLTALDGQAVSVPRIRLLADGRRDEFLSLPISLDGEPVAWTRSGIESAGLPAEFQANDTLKANFANFRIVNDAINVALRSRAPRANRASVRLAETTTFLDTGGNNLEATRFLVSPAGLDACTVQLPAGKRLVRASVGGRPASIRVHSPSRVELQFRHPLLPQTVDIITESTLRGDALAERIELRPPVLEDSGRPMAVDLVLWSLQGKAAGQLLQPIGCARLSTAQLAGLRLDWLSSVSQQASGALLEAPAVDGYSWFVPWAADLQVAMRRAEAAGQQISGAAPAIRVARPERDSTETSRAVSLLWIEQMAELFDVTSDSLAEQQNALQGVFASGQLSQDVAIDSACFVSDSNHQPLAVQLASADWTPAHARFLVLASVGAVALISLWLARSPQLLARISDWPEACALVLGLAAWAWLRPSLAGLVIAAPAAILLVRRIRRRRKSPRHDSSKLPNSIPEEVA